jgi:DNA-binding transcriptional LysR family regulator
LTDQRRHGNKSPSGRAGTPTAGQLRAFVALAEELSFARAATRLRIAPSSLSETLTRLESVLGRTLLDRTPRRVELTPSGRALLPRARDVLRRLDGLHLVAVGGDEPERPVLRIGIAGAGFGTLTEPIVAAFRASHPEVMVMFQELTSPLRSFADSTLDLAMTYLPVADRDVEVHPIATEPRVMVMPADHPAAERDVVSMEQFRRDLFISFAPGAPEVRDYWLGVTSPTDRRPAVGAVARSLADVIHQVRNLRLVAIGPAALGLACSSPGIVSRRLVDLDPCVMAIVMRPHEARPIVRDLVSVSLQIAERGVDRPPSAAGAAGD